MFRVPFTRAYAHPISTTPRGPVVRWVCTSSHVSVAPRFNAWKAYTGVLERHPLSTKMATYFACTSIGDIVAQIACANTFSFIRLLQLAVFSSLASAPVSHFLNTWLDANVHPDAPKSFKAVASKLAFDKLAVDPIMAMGFLAFVRGVVERDPSSVIPFVSERILPVLAAGYKIWIPVCTVSYRFVPRDLRALLYGVTSIVWTVCLNMMSVNS